MISADRIRRGGRKERGKEEGIRLSSCFAAEFASHRWPCASYGIASLRISAALSESGTYQSSTVEVYLYGKTTQNSTWVVPCTEYVCRHCRE